MSFGKTNNNIVLYPKKGAVQEGSDGDVLVLNGDLSINTVVANGTVMMRDGIICKKGTYEA